MHRMSSSPPHRSTSITPLLAITLLLLFSLTLLLTFLPTPTHAAEIDDHLLKDPVSVQIISRHLTSSSFTDATRDYLAEYRRGIYSFFKESPGMNLGTGVIANNFPKASFTRTSTSTQTIWTFQIAYNETTPSFHPYDQYNSFASYCQRNTETKLCDLDGDVLRLYIGDDNTTALYQSRQWLQYFDSVLLQCCDNSYQIDRQSCPDCSAKNYLPLILGCVLGFVGLILCVLGICIACRVTKRKRTKSIQDAGHRPPPKNIGPAFEVNRGGGDPHKPAQPQQQTGSPMMMMRADHMRPHMMPAPPSQGDAPAPVVIKIANSPDEDIATGGAKHNQKKNKNKKEEPDMEATLMDADEATASKKHKKDKKITHKNSSK